MANSESTAKRGAIEAAEAIIATANLEFKGRRIYAAANGPEIFRCPACRFGDKSLEHFLGHIRVTQHGEAAP